jgi:hypothetical protein
LLDFDGEAESAQSLDKSIRGFLAVRAIEVIATEVSVIDVIAKDVVSRRGNRRQ